MQSGEVPIGVLFTDAAVINAELAILGWREGIRELADIAKMGINIPTFSVITTRSCIKRN